MLETIRRNVRHPYIQALLGVVILVFIFFFGWSMRSQRPTFVAKVNGDPIGQREYERAYSNLVGIYQDALKADFTASRARELNLGQRALDQLIDQTLLLQEAGDRGIRVSDSELRAAIEASEPFQRDGVFSKDLYLRLLDANRLTPMEYEALKRQELRLRRVEQAIRNEATVTDEQITQEYRDRNTEAQLEFAAFRPEDLLLDVEVEDAGLADFFEAEKESFRVPETRSARYILFAPEQFLDSVQVGDEEVTTEFGWRAQEYAVTEAVRARHILFRVPPDAGEEQTQAIRQQALDVRSRLVEGADFGAAAQEHSEDPGSKAKGGDLGYFERGSMVPEFEQVAFDLEPGVVSEPVKTSFGYHLILVEDHRQAREANLEEIRDELEAEIRRRKALEEAYAAADNILMDLEDGETSWDALAEREDVKVATTPSVHNDGTLEDVEKAKEFKEILFSLPPEHPGQLLETPIGTYLIALNEFNPSVIPPLEEIREELTTRYRKAQANRLAKQRAQGFLRSAAEEGWEETLESRGLTSQETGPFAKKGGAIPKLGWSPELKDAAFAVSQPETVLDEPYEVNGNYYAARVTDLSEPNMEELEVVREQLRAELLPTVQNEHFQSYLEELREDADIEITQEYVR